MSASRSGIVARRRSSRSAYTSSARLLPSSITVRSSASDVAAARIFGCVSTASCAVLSPANFSMRVRATNWPKFKIDINTPGAQRCNAVRSRTHLSISLGAFLPLALPVESGMPTRLRALSPKSTPSTPRLLCEPSVWHRRIPHGELTCCG